MEPGRATKLRQQAEIRARAARRAPKVQMLIEHSVAPPTQRSFGS
jgi:hypothetical protein